MFAAAVRVTKQQQVVIHPINFGCQQCNMQAYHIFELTFQNHACQNKTIGAQFVVHCTIMFLHICYKKTADVTSQIHFYNNNNNNNNNHDNVYGAVIMAEPLREFTRFT